MNGIERDKLVREFLQKIFSCAGNFKNELLERAFKYMTDEQIKQFINDTRFH